MEQENCENCFQWYAVFIYVSITQRQKLSRPLTARRGRRTSPCNRVLASGPWIQAGQHVRRCLGVRPQLRPVVHEISFIRHVIHGIKVFTHHREVFKRPSTFNVFQRLLQILQLCIYLALRLLRALHCLSFESLNGLDLPAHIVFLDMETVDLLFHLGDDVLVLENRAIVGEVHGLRLLRELLHPSAGIVVALLESLQGSSCAALETEFGGQGSPVNFHGGVALLAEVLVRV